MSGYTKLHSAIVHSTVWREPHTTRIVWITLLALADAHGYVGASLPGLADAARVTLAECEAAIASFLGPDPYSRTPAHEGRRLEVVEGGWRLLNHALYRAGRDPETRRAQNRESQARWRDRQPRKPTVSQRQPESAQAEGEAEAEANQIPPVGPPAGDNGRTEASTPKRARKHARVASRWTRVPGTWQPNDEQRALAAKRGVDFDLELEKFRDYDFSKPKSDPDATFRNWLRTAKPTRAPAPGLFEHAERTGRDVPAAETPGAMRKRSPRPALPKPLSFAETSALAAEAQAAMDGSARRVAT